MMTTRQIVAMNFATLAISVTTAALSFWPQAPSCSAVPFDMQAALQVQADIHAFVDSLRPSPHIQQQLSAWREIEQLEYELKAREQTSVEESG
jgi:hypothetical protein